MQRQDESLGSLVRSRHITQFQIVFFFSFYYFVLFFSLRLNNVDPYSPPPESEHQIWDFNHIFYNFVLKD